MFDLLMPLMILILATLQIIQRKLYSQNRVTFTPELTIKVVCYDRRTTFVFGLIWLIYGLTFTVYGIFSLILSLNPDDNPQIVFFVITAISSNLYLGIWGNEVQPKYSDVHHEA